MTDMTWSQVQQRLLDQDPDSILDEPEFSSVVTGLSRVSESRLDPQHSTRDSRALPSRRAVIEMVECLRSVLFPELIGLSPRTDRMLFHVGTTLDHALRILREQLFIAMGHHQDQDSRRRALRQQVVRDISRSLVRSLERVQGLLVADVEAALAGDPAATGAAEIVLCYPGIHAMTNYRLAHELYRLGVPLISRMITEHAHSITGIDIHPGAEIGRSLFIDHGTGVVIGETAVIGDRVRIYHGVTLGAKSFRQDEKGALVKGEPRHPVIEDDVVIYAGATILGRITVGKGSVIGGNVWLTRSVPPGSVVVQGQPLQEQREDPSVRA